MAQSLMPHRAHEVLDFLRKLNPETPEAAVAPLRSYGFSAEAALLEMALYPAAPPEKLPGDILLVPLKSSPLESSHLKAKVLDAELEKPEDVDPESEQPGLRLEDTNDQELANRRFLGCEVAVHQAAKWGDPSSRGSRLSLSGVAFIWCSFNSENGAGLFQSSGDGLAGSGETFTSLVHFPLFITSERFPKRWIHQLRDQCPVVVEVSIELSSRNNIELSSRDIKEGDWQTQPHWQTVAEVGCTIFHPAPLVLAGGCWDSPNSAPERSNSKWLNGLSGTPSSPYRIGSAVSYRCSPSAVGAKVAASKIPLSDLLGEKLVVRWLPKARSWQIVANDPNRSPGKNPRPGSKLSFYQLRLILLNHWVPVCIDRYEAPLTIANSSHPAVTSGGSAAGELLTLNRSASIAESQFSAEVRGLLNLGALDLSEAPSLAEHFGQTLPIGQPCVRGGIRALPP